MYPVQIRKEGRRNNQKKVRLDFYLTNGSKDTAEKNWKFSSQLSYWKLHNGEKWTSKGKLETKKVKGEKEGPTRIRTGVVRIRTESDDHYTMEPEDTKSIQIFLYAF